MRKKGLWKRPSRQQDLFYRFWNGAAFDENKNLLKELGPEQYFGDESLFNESSRSYTAICKTDAELITLPEAICFRSSLSALRLL